MTKTYKIYFWKAAPFLRLLLPVISGIMLQYYFSFSLNEILISAISLLGLFILFSLLPLAHRFKLISLQGIFITLFIITAGALITWHHNVRNSNSWYGKRYDTTSYVLAVVNEPPVEKAKSIKATASVAAIIKNNAAHATVGNILLYFARDSGKKTPAYGDKILINKALQPITNSGNPGAFDYKRYAAFHGIYHQVFVQKNDWLIIGHEEPNWYNSFIYFTRNKIRDILYKYIPGENERSIASALLIGYKVDLDKDLVQAYSNAGVVHLIAISGLHMGIIYFILSWIFSRIPVIKRSKISRLILTLLCLWFFALLTGASGSVLRSAIMFTFIAVGMFVGKRTFIYNSMAASALILLCYNPYLLWDVGFQLSYFAVLGIVIAQPYVVKWFYIKNKFLNAIWQLSSVSLAAQLFTFPICIYYFHQLPLLFLISNLIAIPLTTVALWTCLILVAVSPLNMIATVTGKIIFCVIWMINHTVFFINAIPFSLWDGIFLDVTGTIILYIITCSFLYWLIKKDMLAFKFGLTFLLLFSIILAFNKWTVAQQKKIIVYNVPSHRAIDFVSGDQFQFIGDSDLAVDGLLKNFHLKPGRISMRLNKNSNSISEPFNKNNFYQFYSKRILVMDSAIAFLPFTEKISIDYIIISKNPKLYISKLAAVFNAGIYIFDSSNPLWKIERWKKDCEELHLRFHSVPEQGAFVTDL
ncbi:MAG: ComEC/Rec2 family competence protein [Ginsengibacter sp.]